MLEWFKNKTKMKRWILIILIGICLLCFAFAEMVTVEELNSVVDVLKIVISFVIGFALLIVGIIFCEKRTLELFIEARK